LRLRTGHVRAPAALGRRRSADGKHAPGILPFVVAVIGIGIAPVAAWLGGELACRLRIAAGPVHAAAREQLAAQRPKPVT
jgi:hypothetical protein